ncbi:ABC transporter ATP-binding protein [Phytoactinopolyspora halotolerans]|uniref:ABC-type quaternary amine transporter n=1 Tax=Phytoactinopolyspora halotolerans TaxID=1981512 RepID=A0A6L9S8C9_9ACTN|nr:ABC transporter ATP-binding protein [Phytoactinopolyspora halotolerans]NEE01307.1 ABC transporter ATP-binding protein [Phytoactinopolyspora halotolerans]
MSSRRESGVPPSAASPVDLRVTDVTKAFGEVPVLRGVSLMVGAGGTLALLGPSGCGKTTLLRIVAGLEDPDGGTVAAGDRVLVGPGDRIPPERRRVGMVFQDWALFPHLTVADNVAYGLRRLGKEKIGTRVRDALEMVGLSALADRAPGTLSGGQQQRIALARAIAPQPSVLLLDEPFSNLDAALRVRVRTEVHQLLADLGITTVVVTHDQEEAFVLAENVAVIRDGQIVQQGPPTTIYARPADRWVAEFVGDANLVPGESSGGAAMTVLGRIPVADRVSGTVDVLVRPESVAISPGGAAGDAAGAARVELVEFYGHDTVTLVRMENGQLLRVRSSGPPVAERGAPVVVAYQGPAAVAYRIDA